MGKYIKARCHDESTWGHREKHHHGFKSDKVYGSLLGTPVGLTQALTNVNLDFVEAGPTNGVIANPKTDTITIKSGGVYSVSFSLTNEFVNADEGVAVYDLYVNGKIVEASQINFSKAQGIGPLAIPGEKTILLQLRAKDVISVRPNVFGVSYYRNPTLVVEKITK